MNDLAKKVSELSFYLDTTTKSVDIAWHLLIRFSGQIIIIVGILKFSWELILMGGILYFLFIANQVVINLIMIFNLLKEFHEEKKKWQR